MDELEKLAEETFSEVENKDLKLATYEDDPMFGDDALGHLIKFIPIKEMRRITLKWPKLPPVKELWEGDPFRFIGYAVGHEGKNSLLSELIK